MIYEASRHEVWDPTELPWDTFDVESYSWEEREAMAYWWQPQAPAETRVTDRLAG